MQFADRLKNVETSAIRELFKLLGKPGIISFAGGFPDPALFDAEGIAQAAAAVLKDTPGPVLQYGATEGYGPLREQLSGFMANKGVKVAPEGLIVTTGSQQALDLIGKTMISPGDKVIVEAPTFLATIQCFRLYGADLIGAPIDADGVQVDVLERLIEEHKPKLVYLIPTFGNPSGATLSLERRKRILEIAARTRTLIVEDDPYCELYFGKPPPPSMLALSGEVPGSRDWLAHCGSMSKILSPGLRVGWLIAPPALLANATMCKQFSDAHTSNLTQATAAHYLTLNRLDGALAAVRKVYAERARVMAESLQRELGDAIGFNPPQGGMFFWARLNGGRDAAEFAQRAIEQLVAFVPGAPFYAAEPDRSTLRLSFATADLAKIEEGIARLGRAL
ncbi:PLP-dependent aminotransferase family protein [Pseudorhodoferax sp. Leaf267]|uniref:aminotransferase-like domain-containing protein n=1 Tax=Pseudorhodoferax sp. Leaf267 TaxID=1736316 RepID=UPI0006FFECCC|nr:PLP-dependent aminotransferase family protein [Pseudorhodoferax sp. Leaf267]KQP18379.1 aspartate aminotransferase [Pseudorhodoferax sp. Leaf267]